MNSCKYRKDQCTYIISLLLTLIVRLKKLTLFEQGCYGEELENEVEHVRLFR